MKKKHLASLALCALAPASSATSSSDSAAAAIPDSEYVTVQRGHLFCRDKRVRFWGAIGGMPAAKAPGDDIYAYNRKLVDRLESLGFNMVREWATYETLERQPQGYTKGDGSRMDILDKCLTLLYERGFRIWAGGNAGGFARPKDVDIINDPGTAKAWEAAIRKLARKQETTGDSAVHVSMTALMWDPRLEAIAIRNYRRALDHVNQHNGLRRGDDPMFAVWELSNEQWWISKMTGGEWMRLPDFFKSQLMVLWHDFLRKKYGTQQALTARWLGMLPGEDLAKGTILIAPLRNMNSPAKLNDANPQAYAVFQTVKTQYGRDDFNRHRGEDVNEFFAGLLLNHKRRVAAAFKTFGRSAAKSPLLWDTGIGYDAISQLMHQEADAVSHCAYVGGWTPDSTSRRYPWFSGLEEPPRACLNVPWLEHNKVEGKPFLCYETQIGAPSKYRAEFPFRILFLASIQDWDAVCWHTMSGGYDWSKEKPFEGTLAYPGHAAYQFTYTYDEVQLSSMHAAGKMFTGLSLDPAPHPTTFIFGRRTIYDPAGMDYAGSYLKTFDGGDDMLNTVYRYGTRLKLDVTREDDTIIGPTIPMRGYAHPDPLRPTQQMSCDWGRGNLSFDSKACAAFVGFLSQYGSDHVAFKNGVTISNVQVVNPPNTPYPVTKDENYVAIALTSTDGKPLATCKTAIISAVSTSCNTGLKVAADPKGPERPGHPWESVKAENTGTLPVLVSRVGCTIASPALAGMRFCLRDWSWNIVGKGVVGPDGALKISAHKPVFIVELTR